jgi:hypothetical protein
MARVEKYAKERERGEKPPEPRNKDRSMAQV